MMRHISLVLHARLGARVMAAIMALVAVLALAGCATTPPPDNVMNQAQAQLQAARAADAANYAPNDLDSAQSKFLQAQLELAKHNYDKAALLAREAGADADLARAKAQLAATRVLIQSKTTANQRLRDQIEQSLADLQQRNQAQDAAAAVSAANQLPTTDMPAPSSSSLNAPVPQGQGFQTVPAPALNTDGGQP